MRSDDLDRALGETPKSFEERMNQTLLHLKEEKEMKRTAFRTALVIALITALLCSTAYALINHNLEWYYNNRFTAYQQYEPEKHEAIMKNLNTQVPQGEINDPEISISVVETSWAPEQKTLIVSLLASPLNPETTELHPMWNLDADGAYVGGDAIANPASDGEDRSTHWLWTKEGFGPVEEMIAPGKQLLLLEGGAVYYDDFQLLGDNSSWDSYRTEDGAVHTVIEISMEFLEEEYNQIMLDRMAQSPENAAYWEKKRADAENFRKIWEEDEDGVITLHIPYTVTFYSDDDDQLYQGGREEKLFFDLKIR